MFSPFAHPPKHCAFQSFSINLAVCSLFMIINYISHKSIIFFSKFSLFFPPVRFKQMVSNHLEELSNYNSTQSVWECCLVWTVSSSQLLSCPAVALPLYMCWSVSAVLFCRYTPSSRQANQEEGKEWLRSHSTGGLQDTGSQSPLVSPSAMSSSAAGKYHFSNLGKRV